MTECPKCNGNGYNEGWVATYALPGSRLGEPGLKPTKARCIWCHGAGRVPANFTESERRHLLALHVDEAIDAAQRGLRR